MQDTYNIIEKHLESIINQLDRMDKKMDIIVNANDSSEKEEYLDNQDMCMMLGVTKKTLYRYRKKGILKSYTFDDRKMYYKKSEISNSLKMKKRK